MNQLAAASLGDLCKDAGIRLRKEPRSDLNFAALLPVIRTLLEMRRAGMLEAVHVDNMVLRVVFPNQRQRQLISWHQAEALAAAFLKRKPARARLAVERKVG